MNHHGSEPPNGWKFELGECATHIQDEPYPMGIIGRSLTGSGRELYTVESQKEDNAGFQFMILARALRQPRENGEDCAACVYRGTDICPVGYLAAA